MPLLRRTQVIVRTNTQTVGADPKDDRYIIIVVYANQCQRRTVAFYNVSRKSAERVLNPKFVNPEKLDFEVWWWR